MFERIGRFPLVFCVYGEDGCPRYLVAQSERALLAHLGEGPGRYELLGRLDDYDRQHPIRGLAFAGGIRAEVVSEEV